MTVKSLSTLLLFFFCYPCTAYCQQNDAQELATQAINYFTGNSVKKSLSKAEELADRAILAGARDKELFSILKEASKKDFELTKDAKKALKVITIDPVKNPADYCLVLDELIDKCTLPDKDKNSLILYYLLFFSQERRHTTGNDLTNAFDQIHIFNYGDPATLIGLMPFGEPGSTRLKDKCFTDIVCKAYLANKKLYTLTAEDKALADIYSGLYSGDEISFISKADLTKAKQQHENFLQQFPNSGYVKTSLNNIEGLLNNTPKTEEQPRDPETVYFWEDSHYQQLKGTSRTGKSSYPFWLKFDTIRSNTYGGTFITERMASSHDMFFSQSGDYLLVMQAPFYFDKYKAGERLTDNERSITRNNDFATVYNVVGGYPVVRMSGESRKLDSVLNLLELTKDNYKKDNINISIPSDRSRLYISNIEKECGKLERIVYHGGLHNQGDTVIYSTGEYYRDHIDIFLVDTKTANLIRQIRFTVKPYGNLVRLFYQFSPDCSRMAIQSFYKYSSPEEEPYHDAYTSVQWSAIEVLRLDDDNGDPVALDDSQNQLTQTRYSNIEYQRSEERYRAIQENNRRLTGTMADKLKQMDEMKRQLENESETDRQQREERKWVVMNCPTCNGIGKTMGATCFRCNGAGKIKVKRQ